MTTSGSGSTFEKHVLASKILTERQMQSIRTAQQALRSVGIEKPEEEIAVILKLLDAMHLEQITADVRARHNVALQRASDFTLSREKDDQFQQSLIAQGPELARKVVECRKIQENMKKLGIALSVSEILIAKKYAAAPGGDQKAITGEIVVPEPAKARPEAKAPPKPDRPTARRSPAPSTERDSERFAPPSADERKRKQQLVLFASAGGLLACIVAVIIAVILGVGNAPTPKTDDDQPATARVEPKKAETPAVKPPESTAKLPTTVKIPGMDTPPEKPKDVAEPPKQPIAPPETPKTSETTGIPAAADTTPKPKDQPVPPPADPPKSGDKPDPPTLPPQDPPTPGTDTPSADKDPKVGRREEREAKADKLWKDSQKLITDTKWDQALESLRVLRQKYMDTKVYKDNRDKISTDLLECGYKIAATGMQKQPLYKKPHVDTILGFRVNPPDTWRGIPNWQDIFGYRDTSEVEYRGQSYRSGRYTSRWLEGLYIDIYKTYAPEGIDAVAEGALTIYTRQYSGLKELSNSVFKHPRGYACKRVTHQDAEGNRLAVYAFFDAQAKKGFGIVGYWMVSNDDIFWFKDVKGRPCDDKDWETSVKVFDEVARSFEIMDQSTLSKMRVDAKGWGIAADGWCVQCSDWNVLNTANYTIEYATRKDFAVRLGKELESILRLYKTMMPIPVNIKRGRVKLLDCEEDFLHYGQAYGAAAYWSPYQREIVAYRFEGREVKVGEGKEGMTVAEERNPEEVTFNIIYHEAFHQYMENMMGISRDLYVPSWINEGMGDYFFGGRWNKKGGFEIGLNDWRLETIVKAVKAKKYVPLKKIFYYTQRDYYSDAGLCYAEGWAICYFFLSDEGRKRGYDRLLSAMFQALKTTGESKGRDPYKEATDKVFAGVNIDQMDAEWVQFVLGLEKFLPKKPDGEKKDDPAKDTEQKKR